MSYNRRRGLINKMKKYIQCLLIILSLTGLSIITLNAQNLKASFYHYTTSEGLSSNSVSNIIQDKYGYIWIATWNGLSRFDGYNFYNYPTGGASNVPLLHNRILDITEDKNSNIWMRMYDERIFVLIRHNDRIVNAFGNYKNGLNIRSSHLIKKAPDGSIFIIGNNHILYHLDIDNNDSINVHPYQVKKYDIHDIVFDYKNTAWIETSDGIRKLDLHTGKVSKAYFQNKKISCIFSDGYNIYAGTTSGIILLIKNGHNASVLKNIGNEKITSIYRDHYNMIWFTTEREGANKIDPNTGRIKRFSQIVSQPETDVHGGKFVEVNGILWIKMTHGGFGYYNRKKDEIEYFYNKPDNSWNLSNTVTTFLTLPEGVVWESTIRRGLEKLEILNERINRKQVEPKSNEYGVNELRAMLFDKSSNELWLGNKANSIYIYKGASLTKINRDDKGNPLGKIYGLMKDHSGKYWISTKGNGLYMVNRKNGNFLFTHFKHDANNKYSLNSDNVYITAEDKNGNLWIATYDGGVNLLIKNKKGKYIFLNKDNIIRKYPHDSYLKVRTLCADNNGGIWAGTSDGILSLCYQNNKIKVSNVYTSKDKRFSLGNSDIVDIVKDHNDNLWIATNGGGLSKTIGKDDEGHLKFRTYDEKDGLPSDEIKSITVDRIGNIWFATDQMICSFDTKKHLFTTFSMQDGVGNAAFSEGAAITLADGRMLFGSLNGYYIVDKRKLVNEHGSMLKLQITDFFINDKLITPRTDDTYDYYIPTSKEVRLPERNCVFSFRFASLNYQLQHRIHYQYKLEGYDEGWHNAGINRMVSYSDVPAGTYTFKVKAFLLESPDKYDERTITVIVPPYILASPTALWIYLILIVISIVLFTYYKKIHHKKIKNMKVLKIGPQEIAFKDKNDYDFVVEQMDWLEHNYMNSKMKIEDMVSQSSMSRTSYYNKLKQLTDMSPLELVKEFRLKKAIMYLEHSDITISQIAYQCGYSDPVYFTKIFRETNGVTPTKYRELNMKDLNEPLNN